jgi:competence protein ComEC
MTWKRNWRGPAAQQSDDSPVVLRLDYGQARFLFASDIDKRDEAMLAQRPGELTSAVVKLPRHGSTTANSPVFVAAARPKLAILSAGARSRAEAQRDEVTERYRETGAVVLRTYEDGAVIIESDGKAIRYAGYKSGKQGVLN